MQIDDIPDYLLPAAGATVESPPVTARGTGDLPEFKPEDFVAPADEDEAAKPDYRAHWLDAIDRIRTADDVHQLAQVALLGKDERAARIVAVWPLIAPAFEIPGEHEPAGTAGDVLVACWRKVWNPGVKANNPFVLLLAAATGLSEADTLAAAKMAVQSRLIYPDGTISTGASRFVRINASAIMLAAQPRRPTRPASPEKPVAAAPAPARH